MKKLWLTLTFILIFLISCTKDSVENGISESQNPSKPVENLIVTKISDSSVDLKWEKPEEVTEFDVYRTSNDKDYIKVGTTKELTFHDGSLEPNKKYSYYISSKINSSYKGTVGNKISLATFSSGEMVIPETIKTFYTEELDSIVISSSENHIVLKKNKKTQNIKVGDWLVGEGSDKLTEAMKYEVVSISEGETSITIEAKKLDIDKILELYKNVKISISEDVDFSKVNAELNNKIQKNIIRNLKSETTTNGLKLELKKEIEVIDGFKVTPKYEVSCKYIVNFSDEEIEAYTVVNSSLSVRAEAEINLEDIDEIKGIKEKLKGEKNLWKDITLARIPVEIGPIPIGIMTVDCFGEIYWNVEMKGAIKGEYKAEIVYKNGFRKAKGKEGEIIHEEKYPEKLSDGLSAPEAYIEGKQEVKLSGGLKFSLDWIEIVRVFPYIQVTAEEKAEGKGSNLAIKSELGVQFQGAKGILEALEMGEATYTPYAKSWTLWEKDCEKPEVSKVVRNGEKYLQFTKASIFALSALKNIPLSDYEIYSSSTMTGTPQKVGEINSSQDIMEFKIPEGGLDKYYFVQSKFRGYVTFNGPKSNWMYISGSKLDYSKNKIGELFYSDNGVDPLYEKMGGFFRKTNATFTFYTLNLEPNTSYTIVADANYRIVYAFDIWKNVKMWDGVPKDGIGLWKHKIEFTGREETLTNTVYWGPMSTSIRQVFTTSNRADNLYLMIGVHNFVNFGVFKKSDYDEMIKN